MSELPLEPFKDIIPKDYEPPPSAAPTVTPNPNEDAHRGLKKVVRLLERSKTQVHGMMEGQKTFRSNDPRVLMLVDIAEAQGLVEGYMLGEQWKEKFGL